ncbi:MAG: hypothetical protein DMG34_15620 [Acidobacteria bacterium]|nr:MAG: hypothetical protein DMG34_15620 [Acidobacteriota bacterium]
MKIVLLITGNRSKDSGVYVETFDSGDKIFYTYQNNVRLKDGAWQTGRGKYRIAGGTVKTKGLDRSDSYKHAGNADARSDYSCTGEYTLGASKGG